MGDQSLWGEDDEDSEEPVEVESEVVEESESDSLPSPDDNNSIVQPVENIDEVVEVYNRFEDLKKKLLDTDADMTKIQGNIHINKSGWRKIATAFNLSIETVEVDRAVDDGIVRYRVTARAVAPNDKSTTSSALCASNESNHMETLQEGDDWHTDDENVFEVDGKHRRLKDPKEVNEHNVMTIAETRAKNRAISDLVGGGEVSAEEFGRRKKQEMMEE